MRNEVGKFFKPDLDAIESRHLPLLYEARRKNYRLWAAFPHNRRNFLSRLCKIEVARLPFFIGSNRLPTPSHSIRDDQ
jgi:hypothetical protein